MPGGIDLDPIYYGEDNYTSLAVDPAKDAFERELFHTVRGIGKPIFGICRGFQLIVREYMLEHSKMFTLAWFCCHINDHAQTSKINQLTRNVHSHFVDYRQDVLYGVKLPLGVKPRVETMPVNSMHHQCLVVFTKTNGMTSSVSDSELATPVGGPSLVKDFEMAAWTIRGINDVHKNQYQKVCEAFRIHNWGSPILAVQWHPEEIRDIELIRNFFEQGVTQQTEAY
jgi:gamma-glutamyl-gamma-aminobutyrate hydrolase PuuD